MKMKQPDELITRQPAQRSGILWLLMILLIVIGGGYAWFRSTKTAPETPKQNTDISTATSTPRNPYAGNTLLKEKNPEYAQATAQLKSGNLNTAITLLNSIKDTYPEGSVERNVIEYDRAFALANSDRMKEGVTKLKEIARDSEHYTALTRALSIEALGRIYFINQNKETAHEIFSGDFFSTLRSASSTDPRDSVEKLFLYGNSIRTTPITASHLATFEARKLYEKASLSDEEKTIIKNRYETYQKIGEDELGYTKNDPDYQVYLADYYSVKAGGMALMYLAGMTQDLNEITATYEKATSLATPRGQAFTRFNLASFLASSEKRDEKKDEIAQLVDKILGSSETDRTNFDQFIRGSKDFGSEWIGALRRESTSFDAYVAKILKE